MRVNYPENKIHPTSPPPSRKTPSVHQIPRHPSSRCVPRGTLSQLDPQEFLRRLIARKNHSYRTVASRASEPRKHVCLHRQCRPNDAAFRSHQTVFRPIYRRYPLRLRHKNGASNTFRASQNTKSTAPFNRAMYPSILMPSPEFSLTHGVLAFKQAMFLLRSHAGLQAAGRSIAATAALHLVSSQIIIRQPFQPRTQLLIRRPLIDRSWTLSNSSAPDRSQISGSPSATPAPRHRLDANQ